MQVCLSGWQHGKPYWRVKPFWTLSGSFGRYQCEKYCDIEVGTCLRICLFLFDDTKSEHFIITEEGWQRIGNR